ncbi:attacin-A-like [Ceratitis capitata]|uniref:attacin-A-like n=1 Tax=Ceratitis capitata TaxID=7213 RepID=UPI00032A16A2|nr:attacin-A-like [Ceratitis capitata]
MECDIIGSTNPGIVNNLRVQLTKTFLRNNKFITLGTFFAADAIEWEGNIGAFCKVIGESMIFSTQVTSGANLFQSISIGLEKSLFQNTTHDLNIYGLISSAEVEEIFRFNSCHIGLDYNDSNGHGVKVGFSFLPIPFNTCLSVAVRINLWTSVNSATSLDFSINARRVFAGFFPAMNVFSCGLGFSHNF